MSGRRLIGLVAGRELRVRTREKGFCGSSLAIIAVVAVLPGLLGLGGKEKYEIRAEGSQAQAIAQAATRLDDQFDAQVTVVPRGGDATLTARGIEAKEKPDDTLLSVLQAANRQVRARAALARAGLGAGAAAEALSPPPLALRTEEPVERVTREAQRPGVLRRPAALRAAALARVPGGRRRGRGEVLARGRGPPRRRCARASCWPGR